MPPRSHIARVQIVKDLYISYFKKNGVFILCGFLCGLLILFSAENTFEYHTLKVIQLLSFFALGTIYQASLKKDKSRTGNGKNYILFIAVQVSVILIVVYLVTKKSNWFFAVNSGVAYALPACLHICRKYFQQTVKFNYRIVPQRRKPNIIQHPAGVVFLNLKVDCKDAGLALKSYRANVLCNTKLGEFFLDFLHYLDDDTSVFIKTNNADNINDWEFFVLNLHGLQLEKLDPQLTLTENKIGQSATLVIKRLKQELKSPGNRKSLTHEAAEQRRNKNSSA